MLLHADVPVGLLRLEQSFVDLVHPPLLVVVFRNDAGISSVIEARVEMIHNQKPIGMVLPLIQPDELLHHRPVAKAGRVITRKPLTDETADVGDLPRGDGLDVGESHIRSPVTRPCTTHTVAGNVTEHRNNTTTAM